MMTAASDPILIEDKIRFQLSVLSQASDAIFTTDTKDRITYWNVESERLYGFTAEEALGQPPKGLLRQEWLGNGDEKKASELLAQNGTWHGETIHRTKDGRGLDVPFHTPTRELGHHSSVTFPHNLWHFLVLSWATPNEILFGR
jgi:PAS domain S-box-containing protein